MTKIPVVDFDLCMGACLAPAVTPSFFRKPVAVSIRDTY